MKNANEQSIKTILQELVETYRLKSRLYQNKVESLWERLMGKTVAGYTKELKVRNQKLYVTVDSAPLRQELSYTRGKILEHLNQELGEAYLKDVIIR
jgi:hypothetical protein